MCVEAAVVEGEGGGGGPDQEVGTSESENGAPKRSRTSSRPPPTPPAAGDSNVSRFFSPQPPSPPSSSSAPVRPSLLGRVAGAIRHALNSVPLRAPAAATPPAPRFAAPDWVPTRRGLAEGGPGACWVLLSRTLPPDLRVDRKLFDELWALHPAELGSIRLFGKEIRTPRWTQAYGESYTFSGKTHDALPLATHPFFARLQARVSEISGCPYTQMLVNWYKDGTHRIGWHADDEGALARPEWDPAAAIGVWSFSYGATRHFDLRPKRKPGDKSAPATELRWPAADNTCIAMMGATQQHYQHQVPTQRTVDGARINVTMRVFGAPFAEYLRQLQRRLHVHLTSKLFADARAERTLRATVMSYVPALPR